MNLHETRYSPGETLRYRFSLRLPGDWVVAPPSLIDIVWQFKRFDSRPDMFVAVKGSALILRVGEKQQVLLLRTVPLGRWMDIELRVRWSAAADGWVMGDVKAEKDSQTHAFRLLLKDWNSNGLGKYAASVCSMDKARAAVV
jgi:hypothetical protein